MELKENKAEKIERKRVEVFCLERVHHMAQGSISPTKYENFVEIFNQLIKTRNLDLKPLKEMYPQ